MSAINMICPACRQHYIAGVVGSTPWPAHYCPTKEQRALETALTRLRLTDWDAALDLEAKVGAVVEKLQ